MGRGVYIRKYSEKRELQLSRLHESNKGHKHTLEQRERMRIGIKRNNRPANNKGKPMSEEQKLKIAKANTGNVRSEETRRKDSLGKRGENHPNWKGGLSRSPYPAIFNKRLKLIIRERDGFVCVLCAKTEVEELSEFGRVLAVNHIDFNKENCALENLNTLCARCNAKINYDRQKWTDYFKEKTLCS